MKTKEESNEGNKEEVKEEPKVEKKEAAAPVKAFSFGVASSGFGNLSSGFGQQGAGGFSFLNQKKETEKEVEEEEAPKDEQVELSAEEGAIYSKKCKLFYKKEVSENL